MELETYASHNTFVNASGTGLVPKYLGIKTLISH
jgi:hypothetical protein